MKIIRRTIEAHKLISLDFDLFLFHDSFEERCISLFRRVENLPKSLVISIIKNVEYDKNFQKIIMNHEGNITIKNVASDTILNTTDKLVDALVDFILPVEGEVEKNIAIDISTFNRENLFLVLKILSLIKICRINCTFFYNVAADMNTEWLSIGPYNVRPVLGYFGEQSPLRSTHLIIILGFELDRALEVIEAYEPMKLTILTGSKAESMWSEFYDRSNKVLEVLKNTKYPTLEYKEISLINLDMIMRELETVSKTNEEYNCVIAPLGNKITSLAVGLHALKNEKVQICYAKPQDYNKENYSKASDDFISIEYGSINEFANQ